MKKNYFITFICVLFTFGSFAQKANMIFYTPNEEKFYLVVNGIQQNGEPLSNIRLTDMSAPVIYSVRLKFVNPKIETINDRVSVEPDMEKTWIVQPKKNKNIVSENEYIVKTMGEIPIDEVHPNMSFQPNQVIVYHTQELPQRDGVSFNMNVDENNANVSFSMGTGGNTNGSFNSNNTVTTTTTTTSSNNNTGIAGCRFPLSDIDFRSQADRVNSQTTTSGKQIVAQKIAQNNCLTARQVYELCYSLPLSADKLSLAKFCYTRCYDPLNYEEVYKALSVSSMVRELDAYINQQNQGSGNIQLQPIRPQQQQQQQTVVVSVPGYNGAVGCARPMFATDFNAVKETIQDADFEATKLSTAKTIISSNCFTVDQVIVITKMFDFEASKLEFAKYAYKYTYDRGNYFKVNTVFDFDASKEEMNRFVKKAGL